MKTTSLNEIRNLVAAALPDERAAQKLTEAIARATELARDEDSTTVATKADIAALRTELKGDIAGLRTELKTDFSDFKTAVVREIGDLKGRYESKLRGQTVWITTVIILGVIVQHLWK
jgi:hypothetical protein